MSTEIAVYSKLRADPDLMAELMAMEDVDSVVGRITEVAESAGHTVSPEMITAAFDDLSGLISSVAGDELTDAELELVAGGSVVSAGNHMGVGGK